MSTKALGSKKKKPTVLSIAQLVTVRLHCSAAADPLFGPCGMLPDRPTLLYTVHLI